MAAVLKQQSKIREALEANFTRGRDGADDFLAEVAKFKEGASIVSEELNQDLEVVFRTALSEHLKKRNNDVVEPLIQLSIGYALAEAQVAEKAASSGTGSTAVAIVPQTGKLPFLLFEDLMEGCKLTERQDGDEDSGGSAKKWSVRRAWKLLEACAEPLTMGRQTGGGAQGPLFAKGKLVLLRLCNGVLRRLSKSLDTEWCGRVLLFLTAAYPLSERSAVNVKGEANVSNVTKFEDQDAASSFQHTDHDDDVDGGLGGGGEKAEEKSEVKKNSSEEGGEDDEGGEEEEEDEDDAEARKAAAAKAKVSAASAAVEAKAATGSVDYDLYSSLWGLQKWLANPSSAVASAQEWVAFKGGAKAVLAAFEFYAFKEHDLAQGKIAYLKRRAPCKAKQAEVEKVDKMRDEGEGDEGGGGNGGGQVEEGEEIVGLSGSCKYLTTSKLLRLQLVDPTLRLHLLTQLLILLHHVRSNRVTHQGLKSSAAAAAGVADEDAAVLEPTALKADCAAIEARVDALLLRTPPDGQAYKTLLSHVVQREQVWTQWKDKDKCRAYERDPAPAPPAPAPAASGAARKEKRKRESVLGAPPPAVLPPPTTTTTTSADGGSSLTPLSSSSFDFASSIGVRLGTVPSLEEHMGSYLECEDPDQGIEEAYHVKHDKQYCWRAARLVLTHEPKLFDQQQGGGSKAAAEGSTLLDKVAATLIAAKPKQ